MHQYSATMPKPRLIRQEAVQEEEDALTPRLGMRILPTIPSAADSSIAMEEGDSSLCAMFISGLSTDAADRMLPNDAFERSQPIEVESNTVQENHSADTSIEPP